MSGYVNNPAATAEAFFGDWFRTGDRGVLRDGYLYLEGRLKEMIIRGGENIAPAEIEQVLLSHPAVTRCGLLRRRTTRSTASWSAAAVTLDRRRRGQRADRALPRAAGGVQGAGQDPRAGRRSRGRRPARCSAAGWRSSSPAASAAPGHEVRRPRRRRDRRLRRGRAGPRRRGRHADRPGRAPGGDAEQRRPGALAARRLHRPPAGDRRVRRGGRRRRRLRRAQGVQPARDRPAPRQALLAPGAAAIWAQNGIPWWYFQSLPEPAGRPGAWRASTRAA